MRTITVLGNNSGRNAGDNAILGNLLDDFADLRTDILFKIPTLNKKFIKKTFGHHKIKPIGLMPWNLAVKNLGWPLYRAMTDTEMILIVDNILFDKKYNNPIFNNLKCISWYSRFSKRKGIPIILYNASVGPIDSELGRLALQKVLYASPLVITRDENTKKLIIDKKLTHPKIVVNADCALNTTSPDELRINEIIKREKLFTNPNGTISLNINTYIDNWSQPGRFSRREFLEIIANTADRLIEKLNVDIVFIVTQIMDIKLTAECLSYMRFKDRVKIISNKEYTYQEIAGLLQKVELHAGMRTHTLIFCAAMNTPMISINAYPKSAGFMKTIGQDEWNIDFQDLNAESFGNLIIKAWKNRHQTRFLMREIVEKEKQKAKNSARVVSNILDSLKN